jgi:O-antigen ligase
LIIVSSSFIDLPEGNALERLVASSSDTGGNAQIAVDRDASNREREAIASIAIAAAKSHPFTGIGFESSALSAHNIYLQALAAGGILAFLGFVTASVAPIWLPVRLFLTGNHMEESGATVLLFGFASGYLFTGMFQPAMWERYIWIVPAISIVLASLVNAQASSHQTNRSLLSWTSRQSVLLGEP